VFKGPHGKPDPGIHVVWFLTTRPLPPGVAGEIIDRDQPREVTSPVPACTRQCAQAGMALMSMPSAGMPIR